MRIALVTYSTKPRGGVVHTVYLAEALARLGEDVTVVALGRGGDRALFRPVDPQVTLHVVPFPSGPAGETVGERVLRSITCLSAGFSPVGYEVVHAEDCISANAFPGAIRTVHHIERFDTPELARCHQRGITGASAHICVSQAVAAELRRAWGIKATVIPNGVDAARFVEAFGATPPVAQPYVLSVGGIEPRKGTLDLVSAFALASRSLPAGTRLVVAGGETLFDYRWYRASFDSLCASLGVAPVVLGPVADPSLPALVAGASVFAFPSVREGFGMAALEAAAAGVPVVLRDLPVFRAVFGDAALYGSSPAELAAGLVAAVAAPSPARVAAARAVAGAHSWSSAARAHLAAYRSLRHRVARPP